MINEGELVYYLVNGYVLSGYVVNVEEKRHGTTFSIDSYGGCEGQYVIDVNELHHRVFLSEEEAQEHLQRGEEGFSASC